MPRAISRIGRVPAREESLRGGLTLTFDPTSNASCMKRDPPRRSSSRKTATVHFPLSVCSPFSGYCRMRPYANSISVCAPGFHAGSCPASAAETISTTSAATLRRLITWPLIQPSSLPTSDGLPWRAAFARPFSVTSHPNGVSTKARTSRTGRYRRSPYALPKHRLGRRSAMTRIYTFRKSQAWGAPRHA